MSTVDPREHDIVDVSVVGGGSAGAVMAARLGQNPSRPVLLLEAGRAHAAAEYPNVVLNPSRVGGRTLG